MNKKYHIVVTTIYVPKVLTAYVENIKKFQHQDDVKIWVIADLKTPPECFSFCNKISLNFDLTYVSVEDQMIWGSKFDNFLDSLPFNNDTRRNIGYLMALEDGCKVLISIDDDNWPTDDDFIGRHAIVGSTWEQDLQFERSGFYNICETIDFEPKRPIYPRGFPFELRNLKNSNCTKNNNKGIIVGVNAGLWLEEPDIDATTWLNGKVLGKKFQGADTIVLDHETWSPINTQNTSVIRDLIPAYYCVAMGHKVPGGIIHRYGDIWGGYIMQAILSKTNYYVAFGRPIANHFRNPHNYLEDLRQEYWGMILTDWFLFELKNFTSTAKNIITTGLELADYIEFDCIDKLPKWCPLEVINFMSLTAKNLRIYLKTAEKIGI
jgi:hypothetical protein